MIAYNPTPAWFDAWRTAMVPVGCPFEIPIASLKTPPRCPQHGSKSRIGGSQRDRRRDLRLEALDSGAAPQRQPVRLGCHSEPPAIVNNQRTLIWQFRCTYTHSVLDWPDRARVTSDLMMLQRVAKRAFPHASRTAGPKNGRNGSFRDAFRASVHSWKRRGET
jgi:hypothetical protein